MSFNLTALSTPYRGVEDADIAIAHEPAFADLNPFVLAPVFHASWSLSWARR
jgi:hypothetical protein